MSSRPASRHAFLLAPIALMVGCRLFNPEPEPTDPQKEQFLKELAISNETVELEIVIVERPMFDAQIVKTPWKSVDQMAAVSVAHRQRLARHGIRVGVTPDPPAEELQQLLARARMPFKSTPGNVSFAGAGMPTMHADRKRGLSQTIPLRLGDATEIQTAPAYEACTVIPPRPDGSPGSAKTYRNCRCVMRVKAEKLQEGWVKLTFLPEIHHGESKLRRVASGGDWKLRTGQEVDPYYSLQFEVSLNVSEIAIVGLLPPSETPPGSPGIRFFADATPSPQTQRFLAVRLVGIKSPTGLHRQRDGVASR